MGEGSGGGGGGGVGGRCRWLGYRGDFLLLFSFSLLGGFRVWVIDLFEARRGGHRRDGYAAAHDEADLGGEGGEGEDCGERGGKRGKEGRGV